MRQEPWVRPVTRLLTWICLRVARLLTAILAALPERVSYAIADACADLAYALLPSRRQHVMANLAVVLGPDVAAAELQRVAHRVFRASGRNFVDLFRAPALSDRELIASIDIPGGGLEYFERLERSGKGGLLVSAHYGPFDMVGQVLGAAGHPMTSLTVRTVPEPIYAVINDLRSKRGMRLEEATASGLRRVVTALRQGRLVGLLGDQDFFHNGVPVRLFGCETTFPYGPFRIARNASVPIIPVITRRQLRGVQMVFEEPFFVSRTADADADLQVAAQHLAAIYERYIRQNPDQWVTFEPVWKAWPRSCPAQEGAAPADEPAARPAR